MSYLVQVSIVIFLCGVVSLGAYLVACHLEKMENEENEKCPDWADIDKWEQSK